MKKSNEHLANFPIAGLTYYEAAQCFGSLTIGTNVDLILETENRYDPRAVAIYYKKHKLGFVPRSENRIIYKLLTQGFEKYLRATIQRVRPEDHPENQIQVVVHLLPI